MPAPFPRECPEKVRVAQATALMGRSRAVAGSIVCVMAVAVGMQVQTGFGWLALVWHTAMGVLAWLSRRGRRGQAPADAAAQPGVRHAPAFAGAYGTCWGVGLVAWAPSLGPQLATLAVAVALAQPVYAVAAFYFMPAAVIAFALPLFAASFLVAARDLSQPASAIAVALIAAHGAGSLWLLRSNWDHFIQMVDLDADKARLAEMLQEQKEIAERAVHLKSRFLASASHDLSQPMHAISLYLSGLSELELPGRARRAVEDARECARDLGDMFRSLLDISRLDAQQAVPKLGVFCIATVLSRVEKEFKPLAQARGVRLRVRACTEHVYSDPMMAERIVLNFVSNAVRHAKGGRVYVACGVQGQALRVAVYDNGVGIPESQQAAIFDEYHRLDRRDHLEHGGGLGLGLAIVRRLAQTLHVPVIVRSAPGRGSMFAVELPLVQVAGAARESGQGEASLAGKQVVLIDDEPSVLEAASFILEKGGCTVVKALSQQAAFEALASSQRVPDAIVCDYELGQQCKGPDVIQMLREEFNCDIPALLVTGDTGGGSAEARAREMQLPILFKPLEAAALRRSVAAVLRT
jgi:signal transduction histidine kinase